MIINNDDEDEDVELEDIIEAQAKDNEETEEEELGGDSDDGYDPPIEETEEAEELEGREILRIGNGNQEIYLCSCTSDIKKLQAIAIKLLKNKNIRELFKLDNDKSGASYYG